MSFILDALRKLEDKRAPETTRELLAAGIPGPHRNARGRPLRHYIVTAALTATLLAAAGWFALRQRSVDVREQPLSVLSPESPEEGEGASQPELSLDRGGGREGSGTGTALPDQALTDPPDTARRPGAGEDAPSRGESGEGAEEVDLPSRPGVKDEAPLTVESTDGFEGEEAPPPAESAADAPLLPLEELPDEIRNTLKDLNIEGHVYSDDPAFRLLSIDGSLKREGDTVRPGLLLETISPEGAVFTYRGYRFSMKGY